MEVFGKFSDGNIRFYKNSNPFYVAQSKTSWFKQRKILFNKLGKEVLKIRTKIGFSGIKHIIKYKNDPNKLILQLKGTLTKNYYECIINIDVYKIFIHKGLFTSIFKNNKQIAYYKKSSISSEIQLIYNSDVKLELMITFITCLELSYYDENESLVIDLGNIGGEYQSFNEKWKPMN